MFGVKSCWGWFFSSAFGSAIVPWAIAIVSSFNCVQAQIIPDNTLGTRVNGELTTSCESGVCSITNGSQRGSNLFHSFRQFSLPNPNDVADFQTNSAINNVIVRVTGVGVPFISNINGTIQTSSPANFFLLNPNGIIFGPGAVLDVGGAFLATTANRMDFKDGTQLTTTNPTELLTITAPIGLGLTGTSGNITMQSSFFSAGRTDNFSDLALVGGKISLDDTTLQTPGGRVELGGLAASGTVGLDVVGNNLSLSFPQQVQRADVSLTNGTGVFVEAAGGGSIAVNARNLDVLGGSVLSAGIEEGNGSVGTVAGDIILNATEDIKFVGSDIFNTVRSQSIGNGGNIKIFSRSLSLTDSTQLSTSTFGEGNAGNVNVDVTSAVTISGVKDGFASGIRSTVGTEAKGNGGNISIAGGSLSLTDGAQMIASTFGQGDTGNVNVDVTGAVKISGRKDGFASGIRSNVETGAKGNGRNINISGSSFSLTDGALLSASINGEGNAGNVNIDVTSAVTISGVKDGIPSGILSAVGTRAKGNGGNITLSGSSLSITDGAGLFASTLGVGDASNVNVDVTDAVMISGVKNGFASGIFSTVGTEAKGNGGNITLSGSSLSITDGAGVYLSTFGNGDAGKVNLGVTGVVAISGIKDGFVSTIASTVETGAKGNGGNITLSGSSLSLTDGAQLSTNTFGEGNAGNFNVDVEDAVTISGFKDGLSSGIFSAVGTKAKGNGGNITISGNSFSLTDGAPLQASTLGEGKAGDINVDVQGAVTISGVKYGLSSGIFNAVGIGAIGNGGNITISGNSFSLTDGAQLIASTLGKGNAGNVNVDVQGAVTISRVKDGFPSAIFSAVETTAKGNGGNITIFGSSLSLINGAELSVSTFGVGNAGSMFLQAKDFVAFAGDARVFSTVESQGVGKGGDINISTEKFFLKDGARIIASSVGNGAAGNLNVNTRTILLDNSTLSADTRSRDNNLNVEQATITISARDLVLLRRGSNITTNARGENVFGGDININTKFLAAFENSDITANSTDSRGGNIRINTKGIFGAGFRDIASSKTSDITATGATRELSGNVEITPPDVDLTSGLVELPINLVDASNQIYTACTPGTRQFQNTFTATGRGGLPLNPTEPLQDSSTIAQWVRLRSPENARLEQLHSENSVQTTISEPTVVSMTPNLAATKAQIVEASSWVVDGNGNVELVAQVPGITSHSPWVPRASCQ
ncbi:filamentous hemagglutinin N-terminal domain-containing protein [Scytonema sp. UIC 10036]|uniref:two-partner secretion domain-containing protein n=1 Tax=Scytonema sp. UIC 10036 TaxID=2304196 RepID=UPI0012DABE4C|nr:filamentous hemagglutinin N-terminal domain-containing protein [Scytonema sp. UIC 10036]MUG91199.1 filamentous hemagglutinin N-terminal domain-containing protein [Scytonema sp. UIC 10036]